MACQAFPIPSAARAALFALATQAVACSAGTPAEKSAGHCPSAKERAAALAFCPAGPDLAALVDPMIGTAASGNTTPAVRVPHGMVKVGPDTSSGGDVAAYTYGASFINGFTHDNLLGPGGSKNGYSQILILPVVGALDGTKPGSSFSHDSETAEVGRYAVTLDDYGVKVELTATAHAAIHRYTFPKTDTAKIYFDIGHSLGQSIGGHLEIVGDHTIEGYGQYVVHPAVKVLVKSDPDTAVATTYFVAELDTPFSSFGTTVSKGTGQVTVTQGQRQTDGTYRGGYVGLSTNAGQVVEVRVGISRISVDQAKKNLDAELSGKSFDDVRQQARDKWNCLLRRVQVQGGSKDQQTLLYTSLYNTLTQPVDYTEVGGKFFSATAGKGHVVTWKSHDFFADDWCAWDTFRTSRPLGTLIEPERVDDIVDSYLHIYKEGGWLPKCTWNAGGYSRVMIGNHAVSIIADAMTKGFACFDPKTAWSAVDKSATQENTDEVLAGLCGYLDLGTPQSYVDKGYVPQQCDPDQSASMTLEYAYDDWCISKIAGVLGKSDAESTFSKRSQNFRNVWDASSDLMRPKNADGTWVAPFDPTKDSLTNGFTEANAWIYTWFVPQDVPALIQLVGGRAAFVKKLDAFFASYFDPSNEPSFHTPYLYNFAGRPDRTEEQVHSVLTTRYAALPDGLPGNDDSGATSAWYVLSAIGIYPVAPGSGTYELTTPLFSRVTLRLDPAAGGASSFTIDVKNAAPGNIYIQSARLNGKPIDVPELQHADIIAGGTLELVAGSQPSAWGTTVAQ